MTFQIEFNGWQGQNIMWHMESRLTFNDTIMRAHGKVAFNWIVWMLSNHSSKLETDRQREDKIESFVTHLSLICNAIWAPYGNRKVRIRHHRHRLFVYHPSMWTRQMKSCPSHRPLQHCQHLPQNQRHHHHHRHWMNWHPWQHRLGDPYAKMSCRYRCQVWDCCWCCYSCWCCRCGWCCWCCCCWCG